MEEFNGESDVVILVVVFWMLDVRSRIVDRRFIRSYISLGES